MSISKIENLLTRLCSLGSNKPQNLIFEAYTPYSHIMVQDNGDLRTLYFGNEDMEAETSISLSNPLSPIFEYPGMMLLALTMSMQNYHILMLGLGGGFIPRLFQEFLPDHILTVVEVDPVVAQVAEDFFFFKPGKNVELVIADGLEYIASSPIGAFDQIWLDAFNGNYIPLHLTTKDFLEICRLHLHQDGLLIQNLHENRKKDFWEQFNLTSDLFSRVPLIFRGTRTANMIAINFNSNSLHFSYPSDKMVFQNIKKMGTFIGQYNLLEEYQKKVIL
ncbi:MAG: fused MFS/spermidine synthase [Deltaproteobacteria bacterium]|jgi:spermidine synthase|nr:fused MFS/spermidine synthase [Deltaproteobacteria bacterium]